MTMKKNVPHSIFATRLLQDYKTLLVGSDNALGWEGKNAITTFIVSYIFA
jgi:hypothetical protein